MKVKFEAEAGRPVMLRTQTACKSCLRQALENRKLVKILMKKISDFEASQEQKFD